MSMDSWYEDFYYDLPDNIWWEEMAAEVSLLDFIEQEMSYADAVEEIATDEGGWGVWGEGQV